jgi:hypothetical protein
MLLTQKQRNFFIGQDGERPKVYGMYERMYVHVIHAYVPTCQSCKIA